jgi:hypothetical protein
MNLAKQRWGFGPFPSVHKTYSQANPTAIENTSHGCGADTVHPNEFFWTVAAMNGTEAAQ